MFTGVIYPLFAASSIFRYTFRSMYNSLKKNKSWIIWFYDTNKYVIVKRNKRVFILIEQLALGTEKERVGITDKPAIINLNFKPTFELKLSRKCNNIKLGSWVQEYVHENAYPQSRLKHRLCPKPMQEFIHIVVVRLLIFTLWIYKWGVWIVERVKHSIRLRVYTPWHQVYSP